MIDKNVQYDEQQLVADLDGLRRKRLGGVGVAKK